MYRLCILAMLTLASLAAGAQDTVILSLDEAGTLEQSLMQVAPDAKFTTSALKVQGPINGADMMVVREMCGVKGLDTPTEGVLASLDLSEAYVVESGVPYVSAFDTDYTSKTDEFGPLFLYNCKRLTQLQLPESIVAIDTLALAGCSALQDVMLPGTLHTIGYGAFAGCDAISFLAVPNGVTVLGLGAFQRMASLETLSLGNGIEDIDNSLLLMDTSLSVVNLGLRVKEFNPVVFYSLPSLAEVNVHELNPHFSSIDGVVFSDNFDTLALFPPSCPIEVYEVPQGVGTVAPYAFYGARYLRELTMPESLEVIDTMAFFGCMDLERLNGGTNLRQICYGALGCPADRQSKLTHVSLPASLNLLGDGAFVGNTTLKVDIAPDNVYYNADDAGLVYDSQRMRVCFVPGDIATLSLPATVQEVASWTFASAAALHEAYLPDHVHVLADKALALAPSLTTVVLGNNINKVGKLVVDGCDSLAELFLFTEDIPDGQVDPKAFLNSSGATARQTTLHVLPGTMGKYAKKQGFVDSDGMTPYFAHIVEIEQPDGIAATKTVKGGSIQRWDANGAAVAGHHAGVTIVKMPDGTVCKQMSSTH